MKKFISGFITGAIAVGTAGVLAMSYTANTADFKVLVNGKEFVSDPPALEVEGRTYLPLRAIGDALGVPVTWNEAEYRAEVGNSAPVAAANEYSRSNPAPIDTVQTYRYDAKNNYSSTGDYTVSARVLEVVRGDEAYKQINEAYREAYHSNTYTFEKPDDGYEYMNVKIAFSVINTENDIAISPNEYDFDFYTSNNEKYGKMIYTTHLDEFSDSVYAGGNTEGWVTVQVKKDDANPKMAYGLDYYGAGGIWFALTE